MLKSWASSLFHYGGGVQAIRYQHRRQSRILMYHRFAARAVDTRPEIEWQCAHLSRHYRVIPLREFCTKLQQGEPHAANTVAITVDDGHRDFYTHAYPIFRRYGLTATLYVTTGYLDSQGWLWFDLADYLFEQTVVRQLELDFEGLRGRWEWATGDHQRVADIVKIAATDLRDEERRRLMAVLPALLRVEPPVHPPEYWEALRWEEAREMAVHGFEFGGHTVNHPILSKVEDVGQRQWEIEESGRRVSAELQQPALHFCYPNGTSKDISEMTVTQVRDAGYLSAVVAESGFVKSQDPLHLLKRLPVGLDDRNRFSRDVAGWKMK